MSFVPFRDTPSSQPGGAEHGVMKVFPLWGTFYLYSVKKPEESRIKNHAYICILNILYDK